MESRSRATAGQFSGVADKVLNDQSFQRSPQPSPRQPRAGFGGQRGVLTPYVPAAGAPIATNRHHQRRRSPAQRLARELPGHGVTREAFATAATTPLVRLDDRHASTARPGSSRCPTTSRPSSSRPANVVRSHSPPHRHRRGAESAPTQRCRGRQPSRARTAPGDLAGATPACRPVTALAGPGAPGDTTWPRPLIAGSEHQHEPGYTRFCNRLYDIEIRTVICSTTRSSR